MYAIYGDIYHQYTPNVSIYTSTMDPMGYGSWPQNGDLPVVRPNISPSPPGPSPSWAWPRRSSSAPSARPWRNRPSSWTHKARPRGAMGKEDGENLWKPSNNRKPWETLWVDGWWVHFFGDPETFAWIFCLGYETPRIQQNGLICTSKHGDHSGTVRRFRLICILNLSR